MNLRKMVREMNIEESISVSSRDYTETTIRNYAAQMAKAFKRNYSVSKNNRTYIVTRNA